MTLLDAFQGANVLITGGLGFIGSRLAHRLVELGSAVTVVDSLVPEYGGNLHNVSDIAERIRVNISDVRDPYSLQHLIRGQRFVFNLAGQTSHLDSMQDPFTDLEINCRAQLSILETCRRCNPDATLVFAGTRQVYGRPDYLPVDERHPLRPVDVNGIHKLAGEGYHQLYHQVYGIRSCVLRLTNTYGPAMRIKDARQTFLGVWVRQALQGQDIEVWGGDQKRDVTYVDDAVDAFLLAATHPAAVGGVFNLGGLEVVNLRDLAALLVAANGAGRVAVRPFPAERKRIDVGDYYADDRRIREQLGWQPRVDLRAGLRRTLDYYRDCLEQYL